MMPSLALDVEGIPNDPQFRLARDPRPERTEGLDVLHEPVVILRREAEARRVAVNCIAC